MGVPARAACRESAAPRKAPLDPHWRALQPDGLDGEHAFANRQIAAHFGRHTGVVDETVEPAERRERLIQEARVIGDVYQIAVDEGQARSVSGLGAQSVSSSLVDARSVTTTSKPRRAGCACASRPRQSKRSFPVVAMRRYS
jgi:hypothetical protein